jgi:signal transduction histidine kinase
VSRPILIIFLLIGTLPQLGFSQEPNVDSLRLILPTQVGKQRIDILNQLATTLRERDQIATLAYSFEADSISQVIRDPGGQCRALENIAWVYYRMGQWQKSFEYSVKAYDIAMETEDKLQAARLMNNLGALYYEQQNYQEAITNFKKGYGLATEVLDPTTQVRSLNNVALSFSQMEELDSALFYSNLALKFVDSAASPYLTSFANRVIGDVYVKRGDYASAEVMYRDFLEMTREQGVKSYEAGVLHRLGNVYLQSGKLDQAEELLLYALKFCEDNSFLDELSRSHRILAEVYDRKGNVQLAYANQTSFLKLNDQLQGKVNKDRLALLQNMFQTNLEESELELLKAQYENQAYRLETSQRYIFFFAITAVLVGVLSMRMYFLNKNVTSINSDLVAQQHKIEEQKRVLEDQSLQLQAMNETKNKLFSILGHDMRSPIAQVKSVVDMILAGHLEREEFDELLHVLNKDIDSVYFTLNNTLKWSMSQMDGFNVNRTIFDLTEVVNNSLKLLEQSFLEKKLTVFNHMPPNVEVYADQDLIEVVVRNIVNNAVKFSNPEDSVTIFSEIEEDSVLWCVLDQGIGMSEEQIELILSDSYSLTKSRLGTNKEKGSGLGLQLAKEFTRRCGGEITIDSHPGHGSRFWVRLPRRPLIVDPQFSVYQESFKA